MEYAATGARSRIPLGITMGLFTLRRLRPVLLAGLFVSLPAGPLAAQTTLVLSGGPNEWDLAGTGSGWSASAGVERPLTGPFSFEMRVGYFAAPDADDDPYRALLPEFGVVASTPTAIPLRLAVGAGWSLGLGGWPEDEFTLYGALGAEVEIATKWALRPEVRVRSVDPWTGSIAEFQIGVARRFGR